MSTIQKRTLTIECRCCGTEGYYEDIKDDDNDYEYGTCYDCEERECHNCDETSCCKEGMEEASHNEFWCQDCYVTEATSHFNH
jgi:hypothetical protein|tara:strand:+ start:86 stop:334 length:249 start_codon:yes stop_codon:yes gene_type:complete